MATIKIHDMSAAVATAAPAKKKADKPTAPKKKGKKIRVVAKTSKKKEVEKSPEMATIKVKQRNGIACEARQGTRAIRANIFGHPVARVCRYLGHKGWTFADIRAVMDKLHIPVTDNCIKSGRYVGSSAPDPFANHLGFGPAARLNKEEYGKLAGLKPKA